MRFCRSSMAPSIPLIERKPYTRPCSRRTTRVESGNRRVFLQPSTHAALTEQTWASESNSKQRTATSAAGAPTRMDGRAAASWSSRKSSPSTLTSAAWSSASQRTATRRSRRHCSTWSNAMSTSATMKPDLHTAANWSARSVSSKHWNACTQLQSRCMTSARSAWLVIAGAAASRSSPTRGWHCRR